MRFRWQFLFLCFISCALGAMEVTESSECSEFSSSDSCDSEDGSADFLTLVMQQFDPETDYKDKGVKLISRVLNNDELKPVSNNMASENMPGGRHPIAVICNKLRGASDFLSTKPDPSDFLCIESDLYSFFSSLPENLMDASMNKEISLFSIKQGLLICFNIDNEKLNEQKETAEFKVLDEAITRLCIDLYREARSFVGEYMEPYRYSLNYKMPIAGAEQGSLYYLEAMLRTLKIKLDGLDDDAS